MKLEFGLIWAYVGAILGFIAIDLIIVGSICVPFFCKGSPYNSTIMFISIGIYIILIASNW